MTTLPFCGTPIRANEASCVSLVKRDRSIHSWFWRRLGAYIVVLALATTIPASLAMTCLRRNSGVRFARHHPFGATSSIQLKASEIYQARLCLNDSGADFISMAWRHAAENGDF
jgi:hypothetical protein